MMVWLEQSLLIGGSIIDPFEISYGCVLAPMLFNIFSLATVAEHLSAGVFIRARSDRKLFQLARLRASIKTRETCIHEPLFVDDATIITNTLPVLENTTEMFKHFEQADSLFGLTMNTKKTDAQQPPPGRTSIDSHVEIYGTPLKSVKSFTYLGSTVVSDNTIDVETNHNIHAACGAFGGLWKHGIKLSMKCKVYKAIVLPTLRYSAETYTLYHRHIRKLSQVHLHHL